MNGNARSLYILCVEDEKDLLDYYSELARALGFQVLVASDGEQAMEMMQRYLNRIVLVVSDFKMPKKNGFELRQAMLPEHRAIPFVLMSGHITRETAMQAVELKISAFLEKPFAESKFKEVVEKESKDRVTSLKDDDEMLDGFIAEANALAEEMEGHILSLEENPGDPDTINRIFACAHTIKGASGFFKPDDVHRFTHKFEDYLAKFKQNPELLNQSTLSCLLKGLDTIKTLLVCLSEGKGNDHLENLFTIFTHDSPAESTPSRAQLVTANQNEASSNSAPAKVEELRVGVEILNGFMERSGEITVLRNMMNKVIRVIELEHTTDKNVAALTEHLSEMHKVVSSMQDQIGDLRKIPLRQIFKPLSRALRDLCAGLKKKINLTVTGDEMRVDHTVTEVLNKCLIHLLRNSADHGIESPEERVALGKDAAGTIHIQVKETHDQIVMVLSDNGRGINAAKVKAKAVEKKIISPETALLLDDSAARMLIFAPGFSTAEEITGVSGRGVGTDMVRQTILAIGGRIELRSEVGKGTEFILSLPIPKSVMIIQSLMVRVNEHIFAVPQENVVRVVEITEGNPNLKCLQENLVFQQDELILPVLDLGKTLGLRERKTSDREKEFLKGTLVCLEGDHSPYCLQVDEVLDMEDIVVKEVGPWLTSIDLYSGATFMADGRIGLIIDTEGVARCAGFLEADNQVPPKNEVAAVPTRSLFLFELSENSTYAIPQEELFRLERIERKKIQYSGDQAISIFRGRAMPIFNLEEVLLGTSSAEIFSHDWLQTMVIEHHDQYFGFIVPKFSDFEIDASQDSVTFSSFQETLILRERTVTLIRLKQWIDEGLLTQKRIAA